ncbi:putative reverse transcriptase domain-containing protein [Tanacetum coccineum]
MSDCWRGLCVEMVCVVTYGCADLRMRMGEVRLMVSVVVLTTGRFHELAKLVPHLVNPESKHIERYIHGLAPQIHGMIRATQPVTIQSAILKAKALTDEAVRCGTLSKSSKRRKEVVELGVASVLLTIPKVDLSSPGQSGNRLTIEGSHNPRNNGNQARGRAFNVNAIDALQDPNIVMGKLFLNDYFATVLFESVANFSFISTKFVPLLIMKPSMVKHGYVIEVADGHRSFDVIIGMDWLSKHKAEIVCHEKVVRMNREVLFLKGETFLRVLESHLMSAKVDDIRMLGESHCMRFPKVLRTDLTGVTASTSSRISYRLSSWSDAFC